MRRRAPLPRAQQQRKRASGCVLISLLGRHRSEEPEGVRETREPGQTLSQATSQATAQATGKDSGQVSSPDRQTRMPCRKPNVCCVDASPCRDSDEPAPKASPSQVMMSALSVSHWPLSRYSGPRRRAALGLGTPLLRHGPRARHFTAHNGRPEPRVPGLCARSTGQGTARARLWQVAPLSGRWRTRGHKPNRGCRLARTGGRPTVTSVTTTRARNHASLALPLPCNAVSWRSFQAVTNDHGHMSFQFHAAMAHPLHPSNQEWPLS